MQYFLKLRTLLIQNFLEGKLEQRVLCYIWYTLTSFFNPTPVDFGNFQAHQLIEQYKKLECTVEQALFEKEAMPSKPQLNHLENTGGRFNVQSINIKEKKH
jgi:hypothetical protein